MAARQSGKVYQTALLAGEYCCLGQVGLFAGSSVSACLRFGSAVVFWGM